MIALHSSSMMIFPSRAQFVLCVHQPALDNVQRSGDCSWKARTRVNIPRRPIAMFSRTMRWKLPCSSPMHFGSTNCCPWSSGVSLQPWNRLDLEAANARPDARQCSIQMGCPTWSVAMGSRSRQFILVVTTIGRIKRSTLAKLLCKDHPRTMRCART